MSTYSEMGINWLPFQEERVTNAVGHLLNNSGFVKYGVTSWTDISSEPQYKLYSVQAHEYFPYLFIHIIGGKSLFSAISPHIDKVVIFFLSVVVSELSINIFKNKTIYPKILIGGFSFILFSTLPFTYRMLLSLWQDVYCLLFLLLSYLCLSNDKKRLGIVIMIYGFLWQYHWALLIGSFYLFIRLCSGINHMNKSWYYFFPPGFRNPVSSINLILACFIAPTISLLQNLLLNFNGYTLLNNSFFNRVGIDAASNIHHGGLLSALQFLGGNRASICFSPPEFITNSIETNLQSLIFTFNCLLSISGMIIISIISIVGYIIYAKRNPEIQWILVPISIAFLSFTFTFQQAMAAHLHGHSIFFAFMLTIGLLSYISFVPMFNKYNPISPSLLSVLILGIVFANIRVSFLTGVNG